MNMITNALLREHIQNTENRHHSGTWKNCTTCSLEIKRQLTNAEKTPLLDLMHQAIEFAQKYGKAQVYTMKNGANWLRFDQEEEITIDDIPVITVLFRAERE